MKESFIDVLCMLAEDEEVDVSIRSLLSIRMIGNHREECSSLFSKLLTHKDKRIRLAVAECAPYVVGNDSCIVNLLFDMVSDTESDVDERVSALKSLGRISVMSRNAYIQKITSYLSDSYPTIVRNALYVIAESNTLIDACGDEVIRLAISNREMRGLSLAALRFRGSWGKYIDVALANLSSKDIIIGREASQFIMDAMRSDDISLSREQCKTLSGHLGSSDPLIRKNTVLALRRFISFPEVRDALMRRTKEEENGRILLILSGILSPFTKDE